MVEIPQDRINPHRHCQICGAAVPNNSTFCSDKCEQEYKRIVKQRKRFNYLLIGMLVIFFVILILPSLLQK